MKKATFRTVSFLLFAATVLPLLAGCEPHIRISTDEWPDFGDLYVTEETTISEEENGYLEESISSVLYAYNLLDDADKVVYARLREALYSFEDEVNLTGYNISTERLMRIMEYIFYDIPDLYWYGRYYYYWNEINPGKITKVAFEYCMTEEEAQYRKNEIDKNIGFFTDGVSAEADEYHIALKVYENIVKLITYDYATAVGEDTYTDWDVPDDLRSIYGGLVNRVSVCAGYAEVYQYILQMYGIECCRISGVCDSGEGAVEHSWNLVKLDGDYYFSDVTWGDPLSEDENNIVYEYFCLTQDELFKTHTPDGHIPLPQCQAVECDYFRKNGLYLKDYDYEYIKSKAAEFYEAGKSKVTFKCSDRACYDKVYDRLITNCEFFSIINELGIPHDGTFSWNEGYSDSFLTLSLLFQ